MTASSRVAIVVGAALLGAAAAAGAEGFYAGAGIGVAHIERSSPGFDFSGQDTSTRWLAGYSRSFDWMPAGASVGVETGYVAFGRASDDVGATSVEIETDGFPLVLTAGLPLGGRWSALARVGAIRWTQDAVTSGFTFAGKTRGTDLTVGASLAWRPAEVPFELRLDADGSAIGDGLWCAGIALIYHFR